MESTLQNLLIDNETHLEEALRLLRDSKETPEEQEEIKAFYRKIMDHLYGGEPEEGEWASHPDGEDL